MIQSKACPRCQGDLVLDRDQLSWYQHCVDCGMNIDLPALILQDRYLTAITPN